MASHIPNILRALSRACTRATRGFQKFREGSMHKRKRSRMAFRPCLSEAFLEDRLVLNSGTVGVSLPIQAIATHAATIGAAAIPAAVVSPSTASSNVESLYDIPASVALNLPTGQLPGDAGTPHSAIGYWGYTDPFDNGFYEFVSETESDPDYFNSVDQGFSMLKDSFSSGFSFPQPTLPSSTGTGTGGLGTGTGDLSGLGMGGIGRTGSGHLRFGNTAKGGTGLGGKASGGNASGEIGSGELGRGGPATEAKGRGGPATEAKGRGGPGTPQPSAGAAPAPQPPAGTAPAPQPPAGTAPAPQPPAGTAPAPQPPAP